MVTPALIFLAFNAGGDGAGGWGIPVATDIAMAVGVLSLLGDRVAPSLKLFLLALAIVDDIGAIVIIAVFYSDGLDGWSALVAVGLLGADRRLPGRSASGRSAPTSCSASALWLAVHESGIHATIAGVALGLLTPTRPFQRADLVDADELLDISGRRERPPDGEPGPQLGLGRRVAGARPAPVDELRRSCRCSPSPTPGWPCPPTPSATPCARRSPTASWLGLVVGKLVGVTAFTWLAVRLGVGELPPGASWRGIVGVGALAGIGFTVSIFVTGLAFDGRPGDPGRGQDRHPRRLDDRRRPRRPRAAEAGGAGGTGQAVNP